MAGPCPAPPPPTPAIRSDTVTAIGGQSVSSAEDVAHALVQYHPGQSVSVTWVDQSGQSQTANVTLTSGPTA